MSSLPFGELPPFQTRRFRLAQLFRSHPLRPALPKRRYEVFDRMTAATVELFCEENVALETEEAKLDQNYVEIAGAMSVQFRGEEMPFVNTYGFGMKSRSGKVQCEHFAGSALAGS